MQAIAPKVQAPSCAPASTAAVVVELVQSIERALGTLRAEHTSLEAKIIALEATLKFLKSEGASLQHDAPKTDDTCHFRDYDHDSYSLGTD